LNGPTSFSSLAESTILKMRIEGGASTHKDLESASSFAAETDLYAGLFTRLNWMDNEIRISENSTNDETALAIADCDTHSSSDDDDGDAKRCGRDGAGSTAKCLLMVFFVGLCMVGVFGLGFWAGDNNVWRNKNASTETAATIFGHQPTMAPTALTGGEAPTLSTETSTTYQNQGDDGKSPDTTQSPPLTSVLASDVTVGAYYYPWYGNDFHKGSPYLRDELSVKQRPVLGKYDDTDPAVIAQHLRWSKQANIQLWVTSWWRPGGREDNTTLNVILPHQDLGSHKIALFYETNGRVREPYYTTELVGPDMVHMCKNYFAHPNYYQIDGRPVIFVYVSRRFSELGMLEEVLLLMRSAAADYGFNPYIIGDQVWRTAPTGDYAPFSQLDAVTNYDVRGGMNLPDGTNYVLQSGVDNYYSEQAKWKAAANAQGCAYVPPAVPGYNDRAIRLAIDKAAVSRRLTPDGEEGSLFRASLKRARSLVDARTDNLMMINSFNEWHEDSQIEPTSGGSETNSPFNLTQGVEYEAYGELYLYILREETM
jgi:glycoprotein endo-alpha-1,2-mannosidase